jgi:hypothetical protein
MENIVLFIKLDCEDTFISELDNFPNLMFGRWTIVFENDNYIEKFKLSKYAKPNISVYKCNEVLSGSLQKFAYCMYELGTQTNGKIIFIFVDLNIKFIIEQLNNLLKISYPINNLLKISYPIDISYSEKYSGFSRQINKVNTKLAEKLFFNDYVNKILNLQYYNLNFLIVDFKALWIKKMFFELKYLTLGNNYVSSYSEFNFLINFLSRKYVLHYNS